MKNKSYIPKWRYTKGIKAKYQYADGTEAICIIPDIVGDNQTKFNGQKIPVELLTIWGRKTRYAVLRGDLYSLDTVGAGDIIVTPAKRGANCIL